MNPCENLGWISPMASIAHLWNGHGLTTKCILAASTLGIAACFWHGTHHLSILMQSFQLAKKIHAFQSSMPS